MTKEKLSRNPSFYETSAMVGWYRQGATFAEIAVLSNMPEGDAKIIINNYLLQKKKENGFLFNWRKNWLKRLFSLNKKPDN